MIAESGSAALIKDTDSLMVLIFAKFIEIMYETDDFSGCERDYIT